MHTDKMSNVHFFDWFVMYTFIRFYFYMRSHGAPVEAKSFLPAIVIAPFAVLWYFVDFPVWFVIIPFVAAIIYGIVGYIKMKKGLTEADKQNINYGPLYIEFFIVFVLFVVVVKLLGLNFFNKDL